MTTGAMWGVMDSKTGEWWVGGTSRQARWSGDPREAKLYNTRKAANNARATALLMGKPFALEIPVLVWSGSVARLLGDLIEMEPRLAATVGPFYDAALEGDL